MAVAFAVADAVLRDLRVLRLPDVALAKSGG